MSDGVANVFVHASAAQRYASARPYFHPLVMKKISAFSGRLRFARALDVGCGTGQSSRALAEIADSVHGLDISAEMLAAAEPHPRVRYHLARAEALPFDDRSFDLLTAGLAFHWFDQPVFLVEATRVMKEDGWLIVYASGFAGEMNDNPEFRHWAWTDYPSRFPTPPRRSVGVSAELVERFGLALRGNEQFLHDELMSAAQLTNYLLTQTNVIAAVESAATTTADAAAWIAAGIAPYFKCVARVMKFSGNVWYLQSVR